MGLFPDCGKPRGLGGAAVGPTHCQGNDGQPQVEFLQIGDAGILDDEPTGFSVAKQTFDRPSLAKFAQSISGLAITGDDQPVAIPDTPRSNV